MTAHARIIINGNGIVAASSPHHLAKAEEKDALLPERNELTTKDGIGRRPTL